jgi:hypothetical protein
MAAIANVLLRETHATTAQQPMMDIDVILSANKVDRPGKIVKEHLILGTDKRDAEAQRDLWLSENPSIKVVKIHRVKREPQTLLTLIGSKHVPRVSITVEYEEPDILTEALSWPALPSEENHCEKHRDSGSSQNRVANLFAGNVKQMTQGSGAHHLGDEEAE